jgi:hypothetical protein
MANIAHNDEITPSCRAAFTALPTRQVVAEDETHPPVELVAVAARPEPASSSPAVPSACSSYRSLTVPTDNSGRSQGVLSCAIGEASGVNVLGGRAF